MPNHYHFLLRQDSNTPISEWLRILFSGYVLAVNKQQNRSGSIFEGKPKKKVIRRIEYLQHLIYYIHFNPVKAGLVANPHHWKYSNYLECIGKREELPHDEITINEMFGSSKEYETFATGYYFDEQINNSMKKYYLS